MQCLQYVLYSLLSLIYEGASKQSPDLKNYNAPGPRPMFQNSWIRHCLFSDLLFEHKESTRKTVQHTYVEIGMWPPHCDPGDWPRTTNAPPHNIPNHAFPAHLPVWSVCVYGNCAECYVIQSALSPSIRLEWEIGRAVLNMLKFFIYTRITSIIWLSFPRVFLLEVYGMLFMF